MGEGSRIYVGRWAWVHGKRAWMHGKVILDQVFSLQSQAFVAFAVLLLSWCSTLLLCFPTPCFQFTLRSLSVVECLGLKQDLKLPYMLVWACLIDL